MRPWFCLGCQRAVPSGPRIPPPPPEPRLGGRPLPRGPAGHPMGVSAPLTAQSPQEQLLGVTTFRPGHSQGRVGGGGRGRFPAYSLPDLSGLPVNLVLVISTWVRRARCSFGTPPALPPRILSKPRVVGTLFSLFSNEGTEAQKGKVTFSGLCN